MFKITLRDGPIERVEVDSVKDFREAFGDGLLTQPAPKIPRKYTKRAKAKRNNGFTPEVTRLAKAKGISKIAARSELRAKRLAAK